MESSCIKSLDLSNGIVDTELAKFPCLTGCIDTTQVEMYKIKTDELILILFKAVQQLQTEIDALKTK
jgi:hypothetical protein